MILVFGKTGQVAAELQRCAPGLLALDRDAADLSEPDSCAAAIRDHAPEAVINAAAYTAVDTAEEEEARATVINGTAPGAMAAACAGLGIPMVQISTDYVFSGSGERPWTSEDPPGPVNAYGRSKLAGETAVRAAGGCHAILRTSWVFSASGANFVKSMLHLSASRDRLDIVADQVGGPTEARAIAEACLTIAGALRQDPAKTGTYHFSGAPDVSWAGFAREIFAQSGRACAVTDIPTSAFPRPAPRPRNSRLDNSTTRAAFGLARPDWRAGLRRVLTETGDLKS